jgi:hypothetical protein
MNPEEHNFLPKSAGFDLKTIKNYSVKFLDLKILPANLLHPFLVITASAQTVYLIRQGEKVANGGDGLNVEGMQREQCLRTVFGASSQYNIGYIIAEQPKSSEPRRSPFHSNSRPRSRSNIYKAATHSTSYGYSACGQ